MTSCLQKLPMRFRGSCVNYVLSILHSNFVYCFTFQCCHQLLKMNLQQKETAILHSPAANREPCLLSNAIAFVVTESRLNLNRVFLTLEGK